MQIYSLDTYLSFNLNQLYTYFDTGAGASLGYPSDWKDNLDPQITNVVMEC